MPNLYASLPVPAGDGVGAWVDVSLFSATRTFSVDGGHFAGQLTIEGSNDAQASSVPLPVPPFFDGGEVIQTAVLTEQFMRIRRTGSASLTPGAPNVQVAAEQQAGTIFGAMNVPTDNGPGTSIDLTLGGEINTFNVSGGNGQVVIEISTDPAGLIFSPALLFDSGGGVAQTVVGTLKRARVVRRLVTAPGAGNAPLVSVGSGGSSGGGGGGQGVLSVDSVNVIGVKLTQVVENALLQGTIAYVGNNNALLASVGAPYELKFGQNLTPVDLVVVNAFNFATTGGQWVRMNIQNPQWLAAPFWDIDPVNGIDEATGWGVTQAAARLAPLKSQAELNRRLVGAFNIAPTIEIEGNIPNSDDGGLPNLQTKTRDALPLIFGRIDPVGGTVNPPIFSGVITGYVTAVPATNTPFQMTIAGLPVSWTASGLLGLMIQKDNGTKTSWVLADLGAKTARISEPRSSTGTGSAGAATNFVVGETVNVYSLFTIPNWPYGGQVLFPKAGNLEIQGKRANGSSAQTVLGGSGPLISNCKLNNVIWQGGSQATFGNVYCPGPNSISGMSQLALQGLVTQGILQLSDCSVQSTDGTTSVDGAAARINLSTRTLMVVKTPALVSIFGSADVAIDCSGQGAFWSVGATVYGAGNSNFIMTVDQGSRCAFPAGTAATSLAHPFSMGTAFFDYADLPVANLTEQCGISLL
jgi:hypothetical protein